MKFSIITSKGLLYANPRLFLLENGEDYVRTMLLQNGVVSFDKNGTLFYSPRDNNAKIMV
jgi:hypothetical protein